MGVGTRKKASDPLRAGITRNCEPPSMDAGNQSKPEDFGSVFSTHHTGWFTATWLCTPVLQDKQPILGGVQTSPLAKDHPSWPSWLFVPLREERGGWPDPHLSIQPLPTPYCMQLCPIVALEKARIRGSKLHLCSFRKVIIPFGIPLMGCTHTLVSNPSSVPYGSPRNSLVPRLWNRASVWDIANINTWEGILATLKS